MFGLDIAVFFEFLLDLLDFPWEFACLAHFGGGQNFPLATGEQLLLMRLYLTLGEGLNPFESGFLPLAIISFTAIPQSPKKFLSIEEYVLDGEFHFEILHEQIPDILEILKFAGHVLGILKFASLGEVHPLEDNAHVVAVLEIAKILQLIAQFEVGQPLGRLGIEVTHE
jgi:hypothetical protein